MIDKLTGQKIVCPWWLCFTFDNPLRKLLHNPEIILAPYLRQRYRVIDIGCGMGYFTIPMAKLVGHLGHVIAIDIQTKMLSVLVSRARKNGVAERIKTYFANQESIGNHEKADFILAFWMVHEVPNQRTFLTEIRNLLKPEGLFLLAEPIIHVPKKLFLCTLQIADELGFVIRGNPKIRLSHSAILTIKNNGL
jgi:2-polyprenyl-3-methyl-5-hydroxy-6-metoxy-1,4-benzoquinol methylase